MNEKMWESLITNGGLAAVSIALIWRAPTLIRVFIDGKKEVAEAMNKQSTMFSGVMEKFSQGLDKVTERMDRVEGTLKVLCSAIKTNQEALQTVASPPTGK